MKKMLRFKYFMLFAALSVMIWSCDNDDNDEDPMVETKTIVETAQAEEALTSLVTALTTADNSEGTDLVGTLSSTGPFTVFAPTNDAFTALLNQLDGFDSLSDFDTDEERELLTTILTYHVVAGVAAKSGDLTDGMTVTTVQGEDITIDLEGGVFLDDATEVNAKVVIADVEASNGVVHVIDKVILPKAIIDALNEGSMTNENGTLTDIVVATEPLSLLEAAVIKADLAATLSTEGPFTVFAPTDVAFVALLEALGDDYNSLDDFDTEEEIALLKNILLYHVIPVKVLSTDLSEGAVATAYTDNSIEVIASGDTFVIGDASDTNANITGVDIMASNGVAHTIDKVLLPQAAIDFVVSLQLKTIVDTAVATDDLSLLVDALVQADAGLVETLNGEGPYTVFAPTNAAFVALLDLLGEDFNSLADFDTDEEKALLTKVLTYHVVAGAAAFSTGLSNGQSIETVQGENVTISLMEGAVQIMDATETNATVALADVEASNGVVHVIDKVLLPQEVLDMLAAMSLKTIVEIAVETDDLSLLVDALVQADANLVETLNGTGPFTVFAPTNDAFIALLETLGDDYNSLSDFDTDEEKELLVTILTYHVVAGAAAFSTGLSNGQMIETFQGENIGIVLENGGVSIMDATEMNANVAIADVTASNGVVHVINKVLLPQAALDALAPSVPNIVETAQSVDDLSSLVAALIQADAGLVETLSSDGPFTVFAPTNEAFATFLNDLGASYNSLEDFDTDEEKALLAQLLTYHVVAGAAVASTDLTDHQEIVSVQGESLFAILGNGVQIQDKTQVNGNVVTADVMTSNGIVHIVDKVLLPQEIIDALH
ncbi:Uncaracterized surface protein containing fasciclin (FAS1) repeats [Maribacter sedimenticola]|uniref:Uncaracterized surface protein containing fasciclin (FAS1) repeats n=1 Tax=Maribacter sedimenticola TaxID=228956 RepID=A0ABY1SLQ0_9FLAO|nr:fasciclin domain-containing protein [Maribacter sedimenticola]SNR77251.1 Uncaracterized surface protein containing fasciclin (FAS1) repeats [Maribacter sedimenticola]